MNEVIYHWQAHQIIWQVGGFTCSIKGTLEEAREIALDMGRTVRVYHMKGEYLGIRA